MAYSRSRSYRGYSRASRRSVGGRRRTFVSRARTSRRRVTSRAPQTVKLVIEHTGLSPVARPEAMGLIEKPKGGKAKF